MYSGWEESALLKAGEVEGGSRWIGSGPAVQAGCPRFGGAGRLSRGRGQRNME